MIASSVRAFSVSEASIPLGPQDLHLWFGSRKVVGDSDQFKRAVLSRYAVVAPADWRFVTGANGKPALAESPRPLDFNLSDSGAWLACAVTAGTAVGLDLEYCDSGRDVMKLARRFFCASEIAALEACSQEQDAVARFYDYWTLKEARVKAAGGALGRELEHTGFRLRCPAPRPGASSVACIKEDPPCDDTGAHYCLLEPLPGYRLATCWLRPGNVEPHLRLFGLPVAQALPATTQGIRACSAPLVCVNTDGRVSC